MRFAEFLEKEELLESSEQLNLSDKRHLKVVNYVNSVYTNSEIKNRLIENYKNSMVNNTIIGYVLLYLKELKPTTESDKPIIDFLKEYFIFFNKHKKNDKLQIISTFPQLKLLISDLVEKAYSEVEISRNTTKYPKANEEKYLNLIFQFLLQVDKNSPITQEQLYEKILNLSPEFLYTPDSTVIKYITRNDTSLDFKKILKITKAFKNKSKTIEFLSDKNNISVKIELVYWLLKKPGGKSNLQLKLFEELGFPLYSIVKLNTGIFLEYICMCLIVELLNNPSFNDYKQLKRIPIVLSGNKLINSGEYRTTNSFSKGITSLYSKFSPNSQFALNEFLAIHYLNLTNPDKYFSELINNLKDIIGAKSFYVYSLNSRLQYNKLLSQGVKSLVSISIKYNTNNINAVKTGDHISSKLLTGDLQLVEFNGQAAKLPDKTSNSVGLINNYLNYRNLGITFNNGFFNVVDLNSLISNMTSTREGDINKINSIIRHALIGDEKYTEALSQHKIELKPILLSCTETKSIVVDLDKIKISKNTYLIKTVVLKKNNDIYSHVSTTGLNLSKNDINSSTFDLILSEFSGGESINLHNSIPITSVNNINNIDFDSLSVYYFLLEKIRNERYSLKLSYMERIRTGSTHGGARPIANIGNSIFRYRFGKSTQKTTNILESKSITEGGNAMKFAGAKGLDAFDLPKTYASLLLQITKQLNISPETIQPIGSTFKKMTEYGDVDLLLDTYEIHYNTGLVGKPLLEYIKERLAGVFANVQIVNDFCIITLSANVPGTFEYVQVDVIPTNLYPKLETRESDIEYIKFAFHSPTPETSKYKGGHRNALLTAVAENTPLKDGSYTFNPNVGLIRCQGDSKATTRHIRGIINTLFGTKYDVEDLNSFESIFAIISEHPCINRDEVMATFFELIEDNKNLMSYFEQLVGEL